MRPTNSSPVVTRLLEAHGVVLGKTHMEELAEGLTTINPVYGPVLNPYNNIYDVGGQHFTFMCTFAPFVMHFCSICHATITFSMLTRLCLNATCQLLLLSSQSLRCRRSIQIRWHHAESDVCVGLVIPDLILPSVPHHCIGACWICFKLKALQILSVSVCEGVCFGLLFLPFDL